MLLYLDAKGFRFDPPGLFAWHFPNETVPEFAPNEWGCVDIYVGF